jgi:hypothetical protein
VDDNLLTIGLIPYLQIATTRNALFKHKKSTITYEETLADVEEYQKLLKPPKKPKKTPNNTQIEKMCDFNHKTGHLKEHYHWNP